MIPQIVIAPAKEWDTYVDNLIKKEKFPWHSVYYIKPEKTQLGIDAIRTLKNTLITGSGSERVFFLFHFDNATLEAQNALLKTLEENSVNNRFILFAENYERIVPTIRSRANKQALSEVKQLEVRETVKELIGSIHSDKHFAFLGNALLQKPEREQAIQMIDEVIVYIRDSLLTSSPVYTGILKQAMEFKRLLKNNNLNPQLAVDSFFLQMKKQLA